MMRRRTAEKSAEHLDRIRRTAVPDRRRLEPGFWNLADRRHLEVDDLDRLVGGHVAVAAAVRIVERLRQRIEIARGGERPLHRYSSAFIVHGEWGG